MKLPNAEKAQISDAKIRGYLLSTDHAIGRFKARFLASLGFTGENWQELRARLLEQAKGDADLDAVTEYGQKYRISGNLEGSKGAAEVVTIWIVLAGDDAPRFVTVYPR